MSDTEVSLGIKLNEAGELSLSFTDVATGELIGGHYIEEERRQIIRGLISRDHDVRGYVVLTADTDDPTRWDTAWDGLVHADSLDARREALAAREAGHASAHVGIILDLLGDPES